MRSDIVMLMELENYDSPSLYLPYLKFSSKTKKSTGPRTVESREQFISIDSIN
jgi:hypothetical protein